MRKFKEKPACGFEGMTYGEAFFDPMVAVVEYLYDDWTTIYGDNVMKVEPEAEELAKAA